MSHVSMEAQAESVLRSRYPDGMAEPVEAELESLNLDSEDRQWLMDRLAEYRELLAYLRDH